MRLSPVLVAQDTLAMVRLPAYDDEMTIGKPAGKARKHHYLPECYLKGWSGEDGRLVEYAVRYEGVGPRWTSPGGTGYEIDLYSFPALGSHADALEKDLLAAIDSSAAVALNRMRSLLKLGADERTAFALLLTTLLVRNPPSIHALKENLQKWRLTDRPETQAIYEAFIWQPGLPKRANDHLYENDTEEDVQEFLADTLRSVLTHERIADYLRGMCWRVICMPTGAPPLMTSDQPMFTSDGLDRRDSLLWMPLGPRRLFLATNSRLFAARYIRDTGLINLATFVNKTVVERARRFVYASSTKPADWIAERFGTRLATCIGERIAMKDPWGMGRPANHSTEDVLAEYVDWVARNLDQ